MFTKLEQHSWIKIEVAQGHSTQKRFQGCMKDLVVQNHIILHDNAWSHTTATVMDLLRHWQWEILEHPPYLPNVSPCNYDLFTKV